MHAYLAGLNERVDYPVRTGLLIYIDRTQHDILPIRVEFDPTFWKETVLGWAITQTNHRIDETLPPADPQHGWECEYCSYSARCGKTDEPVHDMGADGFVPFVVYPQELVRKTLRAENGTTALTPTLAHQYTDLADEYGVRDWDCTACGERYPWDSIEWDGTISAPPPCPACATDGLFVALGPASPYDES